MCACVCLSFYHCRFSAVGLPGCVFALVVFDTTLICALWYMPNSKNTPAHAHTRTRTHTYARTHTKTRGKRSSLLVLVVSGLGVFCVVFASPRCENVTRGEIWCVLCCCLCLTVCSAVCASNCGQNAANWAWRCVPDACACLCMCLSDVALQWCTNDSTLDQLACIKATDAYLHTPTLENFRSAYTPFFSPEGNNSNHTQHEFVGSRSRRS